ncbi:hypothetical protein [Salinimicrobium sediminilitoris]|uniref:hypothetical protein n=1 Tax=Salinimicrobium sediminilitoris TaxID=2876715 RepID=UPI001E48312E|nr:hypothetical protein [Salinimicrobium sediminilitoris]MCC8360779.1 hypothetical protein [Salinimicrobium sediminilitoris]
MKRYYKLLNVRSLLPALGSLFLLASCSSYQYAGYENDGIYSSSQSGEAYTANDYEESYEDALYYKNLFGEKAEQFGAVSQDGAIFTDVESYSSGQYDENMFGAEGMEYEPGRAAWGTDPDEIAVNIYNNYPAYGSFYYPYGYPYYTGFYDPFWGPRYYPYGFYDPFYFGSPYTYNSWRWNIGWGFGWGGYYGYGHRYSPYHPYGGYSNYYPYYNRSNVAYNTGRRDSYSNSYRDRQANSESRISRIQGYSNTRNVRAAGTRVNDNRTYQTRSTRVRSSSTRTNDTYRSSSQRRSSPAVRSNSSSNPRPEARSSRSSRSNNSSYRSSSSNTRSSSSGTGSSSSRSSRGRGGK